MKKLFTFEHKSKQLMSMDLVVSGKEDKIRELAKQIKQEHPKEEIKLFYKLEHKK